MKLEAGQVKKAHALYASCQYVCILWFAQCHNCNSSASSINVNSKQLAGQMALITEVIEAIHLANLHKTCASEFS